MAPAMKWMAKKTEEEKTTTGGSKGKGKKKEAPKEESRKGGNWWNDGGWNDYSWGWDDWGSSSKSKPKKGKGDEEKPKGKSKGKHEDREMEKTDVKGKGKGKGKGKSEKGDFPPVNGAKTVAEVEAEMSKGKIERVKRNQDSGGKQPVEAKGTHCQVHKHSGMGCAVVSLEMAQHREAIMLYAEKTFGRSPLGKLEMDIADVKVQLKRHKDKSTGREVLTDIFVAWGHQQEKDSPLTVDEIAEFFDKLYEDAMASPPTEGTTFNPAQAQAAQAQMLGRLRAPPPPMAHPHPGGPPVPPPNPYFNAMYNMMHNPGMGAGMNPYLQHTFAAQQQAQAAAYAAYQQQMQQQYMQMYAADGGKGGGKWGKGFKGGGKGKSFEDGSQYQAPTSPAPAEGDAVKAEATAEGDASAVPDFSPPKPRLLQIVDPASGKPIDTIGMNFAPRKPSTPLQITNPKTGEAVAVEAEGKTS